MTKIIKKEQDKLVRFQLLNVLVSGDQAGIQKQLYEDLKIVIFAWCALYQEQIGLYRIPLCC
jgi:hypothetical protein